jgi:hypothetical protein
MAPRIGRLATAAVLQLAAIVLAHQLIYLARYGSRFGEALVHSGHGEAWAAAVVSAVVLGIGLAAIGATRLIRLGLLVRSRTIGRAGHTMSELERVRLLLAWLRLAPRMIVLSLVLLTIQENLEQAAIGASMPGSGILLAPEYAGGAWITVTVAVLVSLVAALFDWRRGVLLARLRAARHRFPRRASVLRRPSARLHRPVESELGRRSAVRAPPVGIPA